MSLDLKKEAFLFGNIEILETFPRKIDLNFLKNCLP